MKQLSLVLLGAAATFCVNLLCDGNAIAGHGPSKFTESQITTNDELHLGAFSMSLSVKDLNASKQFYENLGFKVFGGSMEKRYLIMKNGNALIGIFQGMFSGNMLTFNPGWDENAKNIESFDDVREIQKHLKSKNVKLTVEADEQTKGPASIIVTDPDGNVILIDQHR